MLERGRGAREGKQRQRGKAAQDREWSVNERKRRQRWRAAPERESGSGSIRGKLGKARLGVRDGIKEASKHYRANGFEKRRNDRKDEWGTGKRKARALICTKHDPIKECRLVKGTESLTRGSAADVKKNTKKYVVLSAESREVFEKQGCVKDVSRIACSSWSASPP